MKVPSIQRGPGVPLANLRGMVDTQGPTMIGLIRICLSMFISYISIDPKSLPYVYDRFEDLEHSETLIPRLEGKSHPKNLMCFRVKTDAFE